MRKMMMALLVGAALTGPAWTAEPTVAVIDLEELVRLHPNTAADKKLLEQTLKEFSAQKEQLKDQADATRKAFEDAVKEAQNPALGEKARQRLEEEAMRKREAAIAADREYADTVRALQRQLTDQEVRMLKRTTGEIEEAVSAYAKARGLQLVLQLPGRKLGNVSGVIYAADTLDITREIMDKMGIKPAPAETHAPPAGVETGTDPQAVAPGEAE